MKKIYLLITFLLIFSYVANAQNSGSIHYKVKLVSALFGKESTRRNANLELVNNALIQNIDKFNLILTFNKKESLFKTENLMAGEKFDRTYKMAKILIEGNTNYYLNKELNLKLTEVTTYGEAFIITDSISNTKWNLTKEIKHIDNYVCYKATTKRKIINSKRTSYRNVVAWYAPELPISYGPKGYGGLPGLILELSEGKFIYYTSKIDFEETNTITIEKPKKGKVVTEDEYSEIVLNTEVSFGQN